MNIITFPNSPYRLHQPFEPAGDQPTAIAQLVEGLHEGLAFQTLLGVTGSGKTFTMANVIAQLGRPAIVMAPNKTLAAQLYSELRDFFPESAVEYFVSYYDYYQPEAYVPSRDVYIEKDSSINDQIEQMRLSATKSLLEREDSIIVATVSAIYGIGDPVDYHGMILHLREHEKVARQDAIKRLTEMQYERNDVDFQRGNFRVRGDVIDIFPAENSEHALRLTLFDDEVETLSLFDPLTGHILTRVPRYTVYPSSHYVTPRSTVLDAIETIKMELAERIAFCRVGSFSAHADYAHMGLAYRVGTVRPCPPYDAQRDRLHQGHRKLFAPPLRAQGGRAAADAAGLPAAERADVHRREPRHRAADRRHVQGRPRAQGESGQLRLRKVS